VRGECWVRKPSTACSILAQAGYYRIEEYWAFYLDTQLVKAGYPDFNGVDPQDAGQLAGWFTTHGMIDYLRLDPYPGVRGQVVQVEQGGVALESHPIK